MDLLKVDTMSAPSARLIAKWTAMAAGVVWVSVMFYVEFLTIDPNDYGFLAPDVAEQMDNCAGTFQQRYDCKEALIIRKGQRSFVIWMGKVALILGPPIVLASLLSYSTKRRANDMPDNFEPPPVPIARYRVK